MGRRGLGEEAAKKYIKELDGTRARRIRELFKIDWRDPTRYDIVLNTARLSVETAARIIADVSQRAAYQPTAKSLQALKDLTLTAGVEAALIASSKLHISNLKVEACCGEVHISGMILAEDVKEIAVDMIRKLPDVTGVNTHFAIRAPDEYLYRDGR
jgi:hypothetical protein